MQAIRITWKLESETLHLPQLLPWVGREVEIIVLDAASPLPAASLPTDCETNWVSPLAGSILRDDDPFGPAVSADDWEATR